MAMEPSRVAGMLARLPRKAPTGVLAALTMKTSYMNGTVKEQAKIASSDITVPVGLN
jgi:hypothetical protein